MLPTLLDLFARFVTGTTHYHRIKAKKGGRRPGGSACIVGHCFRRSLPFVFAAALPHALFPLPRDHPRRRRKWRWLRRRGREALARGLRRRRCLLLLLLKLFHFLLLPRQFLLHCLCSLLRVLGRPLRVCYGLLRLLYKSNSEVLRSLSLFDKSIQFEIHWRSLKGLKDNWDWS